MRKKLLGILIVCIATIVIILGVSLWLSANLLTVTKYFIKGNVTDTIRIVHLTDLHNKEFGNNNSKLVEKVSEQDPDLIFMTGDMFNQDDDLEVICNCIEQLVKIAPVYYGYGNHEMDWDNGSLDDLKESLTQAGATVLNCEYTDIEINGQELRIGGYYGYYRAPHMRTDDEGEQAEEIAFADEFENTDNLKLLLCHIPTAWVDWEYIDKYPVDVVLCGHYHGGQIRIPFVGGLYAPYVGWFPKNTEGVFYGDYADCVLSTGLGSEAMLPRFNNPPEIVVVDVISEEK